MEMITLYPTGKFPVQFNGNLLSQEEGFYERIEEFGNTFYTIWVATKISLYKIEKNKYIVFEEKTRTKGRTDPSSSIKTIINCRDYSDIETAVNRRDLPSNFPLDKLFKATGIIRPI